MTDLFNFNRMVVDFQISITKDQKTQRKVPTLNDLQPNHLGQHQLQSFD